jgi:hypothetical protein
MFNPFLNINKSAIILSGSSNASEKAFSLRRENEKTEKERHLFQLLNIDFNKQKELGVKKAFEMVA